MLTRLRVQGFKSLADAEMHFGPFTCLIGVNGAGKSNLLDAIAFMRHLADLPLADAASTIRNAGIASLFTRTLSQRAELIELEADLLVGPMHTFQRDGETAFKYAYLNYRVALRLLPAHGDAPEHLALAGESLRRLPESAARDGLALWASASFLDCIEFGDMAIALPAGVAAAKVADQASTALSNVDTQGPGLAAAARREMLSWLGLQLEMSAMRQSDTAADCSTVTPTGRHLPAALERLGDNEAVAYRLARLMPEIREVWVEVDPASSLKTLWVRVTSGMRYPASSLPDSALRVLALAITGLDTDNVSLVCIDELETGLHPAATAAVVALLHGTATYPDWPIVAENRLHQVIISTHAQAVIERLAPDELVVVEKGHGDGNTVTFLSPLVGTWRVRAKLVSEPSVKAAGYGALFPYFAPSDDDAVEVLASPDVKESYEREFMTLIK